MRQHRDKYCYNFDDVYDARKQWYKNMTGKEWQDDYTESRRRKDNAGD